MQIVKLDWESLIPAVQSGDVDCVIAGQSITSERLEEVDFTEPILLCFYRYFDQTRQPVC